MVVEEKFCQKYHRSYYKTTERMPHYSLSELQITPKKIYH